MEEIHLRIYDLYIKTLEDGREVVQIKGSVAFNPSFISHCRSLGVSGDTDIQVEKEQKLDEEIENVS